MLIKTIEEEEILLGIWRIEESLDSLLSQLNNVDFCSAITSEKRLREQTAVRVLLKTLLAEEKTIAYTVNGKPYLTDNSYTISISHTKGYAAVILSQIELIGIDIEYISDKVKRVQDRFVSDNEYIDSDDEIIHLLLHWSAKETLYKALGSMGVDFKKHLVIDRFLPLKSGSFGAKEIFTDKGYRFNIRYIVDNDYVLTFTD